MKALDIIVHTDDHTRQETAWGVSFDDGSVKWYDSIEEVTYYFPDMDRQVTR